MNLYVGNLGFDTTEQALRDAFEAHGEVASVNIITDRLTGRSRGFGFVEMPTNSEAQAAMRALNGTLLDERALTVNEARPREDNGGERSKGPRNFGSANRQRTSRSRF